MPDDACPVCGKDCSNPGGLAAHLLFVKDAAHQAHRLGAPALLPPTTEPAPDPAPTDPAVPAPVAPTVQAPVPAVPAPSPTPPSPAARPVVQFDLPPPPHSGPLMDGAAETTGPPPAAVTVPVGPVLAGTVAMAVNATVLNRPIDRKVTVEEVGATGLPDAAEACIRLWFPDLPLDHPLTALLLSGANLAMLVASYRGALSPPLAGSTATGGGPTTAGPTTATATVPTEAPKPSKTGDPYWDAILAQAGGAARDE